MAAALCPHCGKPLFVTWEVYRAWLVVRRDDSFVLSSDPAPFEGGACEECHEWVEPRELGP